MTSYTCGLYRNRELLTDDTERRTLEALDGLGARFFPATMRLSKENSIVLKSSTEYRRSMLPPQYYIASSVATIPLEAANGVDFVFTESDDPTLYPASLVFQCSDKTFRANEWEVKDVLRMLGESAKYFSPDFGFMYDTAQMARASYGKVMFQIDTREVPIGIFWINYYGPRWVRNIGAEAVRKIRDLTPIFEELTGGGIVFAIQEEPYKEEDPTHRQRQSTFERAISLQDLQRRFPNRGV